MSTHTTNERYRVASQGMTLTPKSPKGKEQDLAHGQEITRADLLLFTRGEYIDMLVKAGDLEVIKHD